MAATRPQHPGAPKNPLPNYPQPVTRADYVHERLSLPLGARLGLYLMASGGSVFLMGMYTGGKKTALQYLAENSHRLPKTQQGWYFYHKTKNYKVMLGGIQAGVKAAARVSGWTATYVLTEAGIDYVRGGRKDFLATTGAAVSTIGFLSLWQRLGKQATLRAVRLAFVGGLVAGLGQDFLQWSRWYRRVEEGTIKEEEESGVWYVDQLASWSRT